MSIINTPTVSAELAESKLNKPPIEPKSSLGDLGVRWFYNAVLCQLLNTSNREYQRERVASVKWKQGIISTILNPNFARIPQVHIRVLVKEDGSLYFELVDGQQRMTAISDFISGGFPLGDLLIGGIDVSGLYYSEMPSKFQIDIMDYRVSCIWYESLDDEDVARLFVDVLNNTTNLNHQEKRNALRSHLITYCRDLARPAKGAKTVLLFKRFIEDDKEYLKYFKVNLKGRMELDEWILECCYFLVHSAEKGLTQNKLTDWVKATRKEEYSSTQKFSKDKKMFEEFWAHTYKIVKSVPKEYKNKLNGMTTQMLSLYGWELKKKYGKIDYAQYTKAFFDTHRRWSKTGSKALFVGETQCNGTQMPPFNELFGGKNANAIKTIWKVLNKELEKDPDFFGVIELDSRETFPQWMIEKKWEEQGFRDGYDGKELSEDNLAGDHDIPRSWGIKAGGVTEYENLVVTSQSHNLAKSNMSGQDYREQLELAGIV